MNEQVSAWLSAVDGLPELHARLRRVELWNRPALQMIQDLDDEDTLFYLDPPYMTGTRSSGGEYGPNEMSDEDHEDLLNLIVRIKGKFILSGYDSPLYQQYERKFFLNRREFDTSNHASSSKIKEVKKEILWTNY
jgi:DNA adenine methylase